MNVAVNAVRRRLRRDERVDRETWYAAQWSRAARVTGWHVEWIDGGFTELRRDDAKLRVRGSDVGLDTYLTYRIAGNKGVTHRRLTAAGLPVVESVEFAALAVRQILDHVGDEAERFVFKPAAGTGGGAGVTVGPIGRRMALEALRDAASFSRRVRIDHRIEGPVARVLVLRGRVLHAAVRSPAAVIGDGRSNIGQLVRAENDRRRLLGPSSTGFVPRSTDHRAALHRAGLRSSSVPARGTRVTVSGRSNTGSEFESHRIGVGRQVEEVAVRAAEAVGVVLAGVDLVLDETDGVRAVLEVNTGPGLHWHVLTASDPYDPFSAILEMLASER